MNDTTPHLSRFALDRCLTGLEGPEGPTRRHLDACARCSARARALEAADRAFMVAHPAAWWSAPAPERRPALWTARHILPAVLVAATAAAAAVLLAVTWTADPARPAADLAGDDGFGGVRTKGASVVELAVRRGADSFPYRGEVLHPGDLLAFRYSSARSWLLVVGVEGSGHTTVFVSDGVGRSRPIAPGARVRLPEGIELDDYEGEEWLVALLSDEPLVAADVLSVLRDHFARRNGAPLAQQGDDDDFGWPPGAESFSWVIRKEAP